MRMAEKLKEKSMDDFMTDFYGRLIIKLILITIPLSICIIALKLEKYVLLVGIVIIAAGGIRLLWSINRVTRFLLSVIVTGMTSIGLFYIITNFSLMGKEKIIVTSVIITGIIATIWMHISFYLECLFVAGEMERIEQLVYMLNAESITNKEADNVLNCIKSCIKMSDFFKVFKESRKRVK